MERERHLKFVTHQLDGKSCVLHPKRDPFESDPSGDVIYQICWWIYDDGCRVSLFNKSIWGLSYWLFINGNPLKWWMMISTQGLNKDLGQSIAVRQKDEGKNLLQPNDLIRTGFRTKRNLVETYQLFTYITILTKMSKCWKFTTNKNAVIGSL